MSNTNPLGANHVLKRVYDEIDEALRVTGANFSGSFTFSGLKTAIRTTTMDVGDTATALPAIPLTARNSITVSNFSDEDILYIGNSNVTADNVIGTTSGHEVNPNEGFNLDITDAIILYGRAPTGKTIRIKVTELA